MSKQPIEAPAVHTDQWKHWSYHEGREKVRRIVPEGCGLTSKNGYIQYRELKTGRIYDEPPLPPDAQAWFQENQELLKPAAILRRQQAAEQGLPSQQAGSITIHGWIDYAFTLAGTAHPAGWSFMQAYFGISSLPVTPGNIGARTDYWIGLYQFGPALPALLQPVMFRNTGDPPSQWYIQNTIIDQFGNLRSDTAVSCPQPRGVWAVVRYFGCTKAWVVNFYSGSPTSGPKMGRPLCGGMTHGDVPETFYGAFNGAVCVFEIEVAPQPYSCLDMITTGVFGGLKCLSGAKALPVNWQNAGVISGYPCFPAMSISNGTVNNGTAQVNLSGSTTVSP
jgi:hypothetical protein